MANKKALLGGAQIKVENVSGFDKSRFNGLTAPLGAIVPIAKQLMIPGKFKLSVAISAQLPPLATDAFLRTHLKVESFLCPLRLCYGGFESFFSGREIASLTPNGISEFVRAKLPRLSFDTGTDPVHDWNSAAIEKVFGVQSLMDYFNVKIPLDNTGKVDPARFPNNKEFNIFPFVCYALIYDHWYRNKLVEKPLFAPPVFGSGSVPSRFLPNLPFISFSNILSVTPDMDNEFWNSNDPSSLFNGNLFDLRQRNYGFDYYTTALPSAQEGNPMSVDTSGGSFTISALRLANSMQHFSEVNQLAGPDMVQANKARYGVDLSDGVAQRPILLGSADFPMYTSGVEQTGMRAASAEITNNPFYTVGARYGRAHAEGSDFVCEGQVKEPSYLMVMASLVPEANYATGISHDMRIFTEEGSLVDLPVSMLEQVGYQPVKSEEIYVDLDDKDHVFGYQPNYMWHKAGATNEVHGLFRKGASLASFIPQRDFSRASGGALAGPPEISSAFLKVRPSDLDNVTAVQAQISEYGVMIDSAIRLFVSEPLGESVLPSLVDPAQEHGYSVYVKRGGQSL